MILLDGPMGTELARRGVATPAPGWSACALETRPEVVEAIHRDYAVADVHRANTFRTQRRIFPETYELLAARAIALARTAGKRVAGSLAPVMDCYRPDLSPSADVARAEHAANVATLRGCDLVLCETFPNPAEARVAVEAAVETGLPVWIALTAGPDGSLMTPEAMERAARDCVAAGASAVLVNCVAADRTLPYVKRLASAGVPFGAYANAGVDWNAAPSPEAYAEIARSWIDVGATIVGACCGCGPAHVTALAKMLGRAG